MLNKRGYLIHWDKSKNTDNFIAPGDHNLMNMQLTLHSHTALVKIARPGSWTLLSAGLSVNMSANGESMRVCQVLCLYREKKNNVAL